MRLEHNTSRRIEAMEKDNGELAATHCSHRLPLSAITLSHPSKELSTNILRLRTANPLVRSLSSLSYHLYTLWLFTYSSHKDTVYPSVAFAASTALSSPFNFSVHPSPITILTSLFTSLLWAWLALLFFSLHNQHHPSSVLEDAINKPWRPLPSGRITTSQTRVLLLTCYPVWGGISYHFGCTRQCVGLTLVTLYYCELGGCQQGGFMRNLLNALGYSFFFAGALQVFISMGNNGVVDLEMGVDVYEGKPLVWLIAVCALIFTTVHAQDFRDEEGDRARGRKTVQTTLGDAASRWLVVVGAGLWSVVVSVMLELEWVVVSVLLALAACLGWFMLPCLLCERTVEKDVRAYKAWIAWAVAVILAPLMQTVVDHVWVSQGG
ncbi:UbiA prenyltransferase family-domain-containing protein [Immersiella caudata]|uniref:UbiA prenyltransferase family-domain-containing protein n=1 Tax=Immersiella caudata TaxID=314043 RepID=A0AA40BV22_9PEZI|nr:UbiA prenyltransferase family-domain-containing protein [Immersiella caudata]